MSQTPVRLISCFAFLSLYVACSPIQYSYRDFSYSPLTEGAVKRIAVVGWAPRRHPEIAALAARVAADRIRLRKNYLVHQAKPITVQWAEACESPIQGVVTISLRRIERQLARVDLLVAASLHRCADGALLWRVEGSDVVASDEPDLAKLAESYENDFGDTARQYAVPIFVLLQDLLVDLPDPQLSDEELMEKIELDG